MDVRFLGATGIKKNISTLGLFLLLACTVWGIHAQGKTLQTAGDVLLVSLPVASLTGTLLVGTSRGQSSNFLKEDIDLIISKSRQLKFSNMNN
ncbi:MAG: hypothetical protein DSY83_03845 [Flavobacteriia bacterium]|nr:MAG: hypothetical protein DSY83_03845 [Flavobacteriia bacterium]